MPLGICVSQVEKHISLPTLNIGGAVGVRVRKWQRAGSAEKDTILGGKKLSKMQHFETCCFKLLDKRSSLIKDL